MTTPWIMVLIILFANGPKQELRRDDLRFATLEQCMKQTSLELQAFMAAHHNWLVAQKGTVMITCIEDGVKI